MQKQLVKGVATADAAADPRAPLAANAQQVCESLCRLLRNLCFDRANARTLAESGAVPLLVSLIERGSVPVQISAVGCLISMAQNPADAVAIGNYGAVPVLLEMLAAADEMCRLTAIQVVHQLARQPANRRRLVAAGGAAVLVGVCVNEKGVHARLMREDAAGALQQLALETGLAVRLALVEANVFKPAFALLRDGTTKGKQSAAAILCALRDLLDDDVALFKSRERVYVKAGAAAAAALVVLRCSATAAAAAAAAAATTTTTTSY